MIPWCSGLSLRALFYTEPFFPNYVLDKKTGILQKDRRSETWTVLSRIDSLWNHISQKRKDFESKPDTGLISKDVVRVVHKFVQYVLKVRKERTYTIVSMMFIALKKDYDALFTTLLSGVLETGEQGGQLPPTFAEN